MNGNKFNLKSDFSRNVLTLFTGTAIAQAIPILISPILTRLYSPNDFGIFSAYLAIVSILGLFATWKFELAIPLEKEDCTAEIIFRIAIFISIIMVIVYGIGMIIFKDYINNIIDIPFTNYTIISILAGVFAIGIYQVYNYWYIRKKNFLIISQSKVLKTLVMAVIQLVSGFIQPGFASLVFGDVLGRGTGNSPLFYMKKRSINKVSFKTIFLLLKKYRKFLLFTGPAYLLNSLSFYITPLILISLYGSEISGYFSLSQRIIGLPIILIGQTISQVYYNQASALIRQGVSLYELYSRVVKKLFLFSVIPAIILLFFGRNIFQIIFGNQWAQAGLFAQIMAIPYLLRFIVNPVSQTLLIIKKQNIQFYWDISRVILIVIIFYFCKINVLDAYITVGIYSFGMMIMYLVQYFIMKKYIKSYESDINR